MPIPWKLLGAAGFASVAAGGAILVRRRRAQADVADDELRERLHARLVEARARMRAPAPATGR